MLPPNPVPKRIPISMKPILIVKAGGTYPDMAARYGDFEDWFIVRMDP